MFWLEQKTTNKISYQDIILLFRILFNKESFKNFLE